MEVIRRSDERGHASHGWLESRHSFSFADYFDAEHVEFGPLRVINEDRVLPGAGFGTHSHANMEIITYVLEGALAHQDSIGNGSVIRSGQVQRMSAGSGIRHSEFNASKTEPVHFLQIWIQPNVRDGAPSYEEAMFAVEERRGRLRLVASPNGAARSVKLNQDARMFVGLFNGAERDKFVLDKHRRAYIHMARGSVDVNGTRLHAGDGLKASDVEMLTLENGTDAEVIAFDLPG
jgi:quercetin 2,3-dioxygenase